MSFVYIKCKKPGLKCMGIQFLKEPVLVRKNVAEVILRNPDFYEVKDVKEKDFSKKRFKRPEKVENSFKEVKEDGKVNENSRN